MNKPGKFSVSGALGTGFIVGGHAVTGNDAAYNPVLDIHNVSMQDAYKKGFRGELGVGYRIGKKNELTVNGYYQQAKGKDTTLGQHISGSPLEGQLSAYKGYGVELGLRHNMNTFKAPLIKNITPFIEARLGFGHVSDIAINDLRVAGTAIGPVSTPFYEGGWVPTASGLIGFEKPISRHMSIGLETGIRYEKSLSADSTFVPVVPGGPLGQSANGGSRWSVPIQIRGRYRF
ncbi:MAG: hypothetical protein COA69_12425 [Robiginitomaculum sp.]|nr:MAG: hypothetical protein COA69_12425 [Robiginitomaculum sp.]